ncbi:MAG: hypothetical protein IJV27_04190 [Prevotella sp.]|nr:hypothetical protein [Prevotella sp.]
MERRTEGKKDRKGENKSGEKITRRIEVSSDVRRKIEKVFGVTGRTVSNALNYTGERGQTDLAKRIRVMALENGGRHVVTLPECETIHDERSGQMVQTFLNGAELVIDKNTGDAKVRDPKGKVRMRRENILVKDIYVLQECAMTF